MHYATVLFLFLALPLRGEEIKDLEALNRELAGSVLDYTRNHRRDRRMLSSALEERRDLYVYLPPGYSLTERYPLVLWLHGYGGDERQFLKQAVRLLDAAIVKGDLPPVIAAAPDGSLRGDFLLGDHGSWFTNSRQGRFEDYIVEDVLGFLYRHFPLERDRGQRVAMGWSMGGFASYKIGMRFPETFGVLVGIYPNLNMRWADCQGNYRADFDPNCWGTLEELDPSMRLGVVPDLHFPVSFDWALCRVWGRGREAVRRLSEENPIELLDRAAVRDGQYDMYITYGRHDEYNVDAQVESFLYRARQLGLEVWVRYHPEGHHHSKYVPECLPDTFRWVGWRLRLNRRLASDSVQSVEPETVSGGRTLLPQRDEPSQPLPSSRP